MKVRKRAGMLETLKDRRGRAGGIKDSRRGDERDGLGLFAEERGRQTASDR